MIIFYNSKFRHLPKIIYETKVRMSKSQTLFIIIRETYKQKLCFQTVTSKRNTSMLVGKEGIFSVD